VIFYHSKSWDLAVRSSSLKKNVFHSFEQNLPKYFLKHCFWYLRLLAQIYSCLLQSEKSPWTTFCPQAAQCELDLCKYITIVLDNCMPSNWARPTSKTGVWHTRNACAVGPSLNWYHPPPYGISIWFHTSLCKIYMCCYHIWVSSHQTIYMFFARMWHIIRLGTKQNTSPKTKKWKFDRAKVHVTHLWDTLIAQLHPSWRYIFLNLVVLDGIIVPKVSFLKSIFTNLYYFTSPTSNNQSSIFKILNLLFIHVVLGCIFC